MTAGKGQKVMNVDKTGRDRLVTFDGFIGTGRRET